MHDTLNHIMTVELEKILISLLKNVMYDIYCVSHWILEKKKVVKKLFANVNEKQLGVIEYGKEINKKTVSRQIKILEGDLYLLIFQIIFTTFCLSLSNLRNRPKMSQLAYLVQFLFIS